MTDKEEAFIIKKVVEGDKSAYALLVNEYKSQAYTLALRIVKNKMDAEEISQDAFLKAYKSLSKFKRESSFSTWLYRIVYNTALTKINKKQLDTTSIDDSHFEVGDSFTNTMSGLVREDRMKFVEKVIERLPEEEAILINLYYTHEKDMREIGEITGLSHANVRVKLSRTRNKLLKSLQEELKGEESSIL